MVSSFGPSLGLGAEVSRADFFLGCGNRAVHPAINSSEAEILKRGKPRFAHKTIFCRGQWAAADDLNLLRELLSGFCCLERPKCNRPHNLVLPERRALPLFTAMYVLDGCPSGKMGTTGPPRQNCSLQPIYTNTSLVRRDYPKWSIKYLSEVDFARGGLKIFCHLL